MNHLPIKYSDYITQNKQQFYVLLFVLSVCMFVYIVGWQLIEQTAWYKGFIWHFNSFTETISIQFIKWFERDISPKSKLVEYSVNLTMPINSYKLYFISFIMLTLIPVRQYKYLLLFIFGSLLFVSLRAAAITAIQFAFKDQIHEVLLTFLDPLIYVPMLIMVLFILNENPFLKPLYKTLRIKFNELLNVSFETLLILLILVTPLTRIIVNYVNRGMLDQLTKITLDISQTILGWFGYTTVISSNFIYLGKFWLSLEQQCIGLGVITIVFILVSAVKGKRLNKLIFLAGFFVAFTIMNSIRLATLLVVIKHFYYNGVDKVFLHDTITYAMYLFAFFSFILYYFWFQDIDLLKYKNKIVQRL